MKYGLTGKFTAVEGKRDELLAILLKASKLLEANKDCIHYLVGTTDDQNDVWVVETWTTKESHEVSLTPEEIRTLIQQAMPLIASMSGQAELQIHGGKGV